MMYLKFLSITLILKIGFCVDSCDIYNDSPVALGDQSGDTVFLDADNSVEEIAICGYTTAPDLIQAFTQRSGNDVATPSSLSSSFTKLPILIILEPVNNFQQYYRMYTAGDFSSAPLASNKQEFVKCGRARSIYGGVAATENPITFFSFTASSNTDRT